MHLRGDRGFCLKHLQDRKLYSKKGTEKPVPFTACTSEMLPCILCFD